FWVPLDARCFLQRNNSDQTKIQ
ncbi:hypothetical protein PM8797T_30968, partial [Gimesia maris DSM 8797]